MYCALLLERVRGHGLGDLCRHRASRAHYRSAGARLLPVGNRIRRAAGSSCSVRRLRATGARASSNHDRLVPFGSISLGVFFLTKWGKRENTGMVARARTMRKRSLFIGTNHGGTLTPTTPQGDGYEERTSVSDPLFTEGPSADPAFSQPGVSRWTLRQPRHGTDGSHHTAIGPTTPRPPRQKTVSRSFRRVEPF